jgi:hypothetical protein
LAKPGDLVTNHQRRPGHHRLDAKQARRVLAALNSARTNRKRMEACVAACANDVPDKSKKGGITRA